MSHCTASTPAARTSHAIEATDGPTWGSRRHSTRVTRALDEQTLWAAAAAERKRVRSRAYMAEQLRLHPEKCRQARAKYRNAHPDRIHEREVRYREANRQLLRDRVARYRVANLDKCLARGRVYRAANRDKCNAATAAWAKANPEKNQAAQNKWRAANPDKLKAKNARHYQKHKDRIAIVTKAWQDANPDKVLMYGRRGSAKFRLTHPNHGREYREANPERCHLHREQRRARVAGVEHNLPIELKASILREHGGACAYCRVTFTTDETIHWDHGVPLVCGAGLVLGNAYPSHQRCNSEKHVLTAVEFLYRRAKAGDHRACVDLKQEVEVSNP